MSPLHRTHTDDDVVVTDDRPVDYHPTTRTRARSWSFAPGQLVSLIVGAGFIIVGLLALLRAELDGPLDTPVVEVLGFTHTAWLGLAEIGLGLLLVLAGTGAWGRPLSVLLGTAMVIAGVLVLADPGQVPNELAVEEDFGWPLVILGALVGLSALVFPVWRSDTVDRDGYDGRTTTRVA